PARRPGRSRNCGRGHAGRSALAAGWRAEPCLIDGVAKAQVGTTSVRTEAIVTAASNRGARVAERTRVGEVARMAGGLRNVTRVQPVASVARAKVARAKVARAKVASVARAKVASVARAKVARARVASV